MRPQVGHFHVCTELKNNFFIFFYRGEGEGEGGLALVRNSGVSTGRESTAFSD